MPPSGPDEHQDIYDSEKSGGKKTPPSDEGLRHITGIRPGEEKEMDRRALQDKETLADSRGGVPDDHESEALSYWRGQDSKKSQNKKGFGSFLASFRSPRRALIGSVAGGGIAALIITIIMILVPLKIETIVQNLEHKYFAAGDNAVQKEADSILSSYYRNVVLKNFGPRCRATIDIGCRAKPITGKDLFSAAFRGLAGQDSNGNPRFEPFEHKLAREKGILIKKDAGGRLFLSTPDLPGNGLDISDLNKAGMTISDIIDNSPDQGAFKRVSKRQLRAQILAAYDDETKFKKIIYRFKVGRLLETKYHVRRFLPDNPIANTYLKGKNNFKAFLAERLLQPYNDELGIVVICLFDDSPACDPIKATTDNNPRTVTAAGCQSGCEDNGSAKSLPEKQIDSELEALSAKFVRSFSQKDLERLQGLYADINKNGLKGYLIRQAGDKLLSYFISDGEQRANHLKDLATYFGVIGAMDKATVFVHSINDLPKKLQKFNYIMNSTAMVSLFTMYRSYADQIHQGHVSTQTIGSLTDALGVNNNPHDRVGGTAQAEQSPLYDAVLGSGYKGPSNNTLGSLLGGTAYAASTKPAYTCADGNPVKTGKPICDEENLKQLATIKGNMKFIYSLPFWPLISQLAAWWGPVQSFISKILSYIAQGLYYLAKPIIDFIIKTFLQPALAFLGSMISGLIDKLLGQILPPSPLSSNMSGGRTVNMLIGGADQAGNDHAHNSLGGVKLTPAQQTAILDEQQNYDYQRYSHQSFFARLFDTSYTSSPINQLALAMPSSTSSAASNTVASFASNPLGKIFGSFGSIFSLGKANAAATVTEDPFGIDQYGYPLNDPIYKADPKEYWKQHCVPDPNNPATDLTKNWNEAAARLAEEQANNNDPNATLMPLNTADLVAKYPDLHLGDLSPTGTNPCLLIQASVAGVAGLRTTDVFSPEDLTASGGGN